MGKSFFNNFVKAIALMIIFGIHEMAFCQAPIESNSLAKDTDIGLLIGTWQNSPSPNPQGQMQVSVEFKNASRAIVTTTFASPNDSTYTETKDCNVRKKADHIELEPRTKYSYSKEYHWWYEIPLPFDSSKLVFTRILERDAQKSQTQYILQKKPK